MNTSKQARIENAILYILDHSKPTRCQDCKHYEECYREVNSETVHYTICQFRSWDRQHELDKIRQIIKE